MILNTLHFYRENPNEKCRQNITTLKMREQYVNNTIIIIQKYLTFIILILFKIRAVMVKLIIGHINNIQYSKIYQDKE